MSEENKEVVAPTTKSFTPKLVQELNYNPNLRFNGREGVIRKVMVPMANFKPMECELPAPTFDEWLQMFPYQIPDNHIMVLPPQMYQLTKNKIILNEDQIKTQFEERSLTGFYVLKTGKMTTDDSMANRVIEGRTVMLRQQSQIEMDRVINLYYHSWNLDIIDSNRELMKKNATRNPETDTGEPEVQPQDVILPSEMMSHYFGYAVYVVPVFDVYGVY